MRTFTLRGSPGGPGRGGGWRRRVTEAAGAWAGGDGVRLDFTLEPRRWIDLDTLAEEALAGLRDAGAWPRGFRGLDAIVATKRDEGAPGLRVEALPAGRLAAMAAPGPALLRAEGDELPRGRAGKERWRERIAAAWHGPPLDGLVWCDLGIGGRGSLLAALEPALDCLEPALGRDPRGRPWQEFFPWDDRIVWLRVRRTAEGPALALRLGPLGA